MINKAKRSWIDVSVPLRNMMVQWPGDPPVSIKRVKDIGRGDKVNISVISMGTHSGTHVDAPVHFIREGDGVDNVSLNTMVGRARVIEIRSHESINPEELAKYHIRRGERILFKTKNSLSVWQKEDFVEDFVFISDGAADFLVDRGARLVGVDYLSVGSFKQGGSYVHRTLLGAGILVIEGLNLSNVTPGKYDLICLPLKIAEGDGAPARVILRPTGR
jgi:arylformamidase